MRTLGRRIRQRANALPDTPRRPSVAGMGHVSGSAGFARWWMLTLIPLRSHSILPMTLLACLCLAGAACGESPVRRAEAFPDIRCQVASDGSQEVVLLKPDGGTRTAESIASNLLFNARYSAEPPEGRFLEVTVTARGEETPRSKVMYPIPGDVALRNQFEHDSTSAVTGKHFVFNPASGESLVWFCAVPEPGEENRG